MEHEKYSYVEALRWLANKYGVEIEEINVIPEDIPEPGTGYAFYNMDS